MKPYHIFTKPDCPHCVAAKHLLTQRGQSFTEYDVAANPAYRHLLRAAFYRTVPIVFDQDWHPIGTFNDLADHLDNTENPLEAAN